MRYMLSQNEKLRICEFVTKRYQSASFDWKIEKVLELIEQIDTDRTFDGVIAELSDTVMCSKDKDCLPVLNDFTTTGIIREHNTEHKIYQKSYVMV